MRMSSLPVCRSNPTRFQQSPTPVQGEPPRTPIPTDMLLLQRPSDQHPTRRDIACLALTTIAVLPTLNTIHSTPSATCTTCFDLYTTVLVRL
jgi:hypothetical protein